MRGDNHEIRQAVQEAVDFYLKALDLETNNSECNLLIHRELVKAYSKQEKTANMKQLKLYFFDLEMESIDRILYYSGPDSAESQVLIAQGATNFSRLRLLLNNETSANKSGYLEKVFINMNALNCEFRCRIAWQISKAYYK